MFVNMFVPIKLLLQLSSVKLINSVLFIISLHRNDIPTGRVTLCKFKRFAEYNQCCADKVSCVCIWLCDELSFQSRKWPVYGNCVWDSLCACESASVQIIGLSWCGDINEHHSFCRVKSLHFPEDKTGFYLHRMLLVKLAMC